ncbi:ribonuclease HII [Bacillus sp. B1-b2]|uniref:ribonuclease HII n=1 Tax=Bacillus sp. B1-b2 TaxID=2653201 RepID=UPI001261C3BB|nr:ribonuclease HII [Bacillus sp. B1-b2]KAB7668623.1 ribonuclease HII [Bacillus sp. B1-b2]
MKVETMKEIKTALETIIDLEDPYIQQLRKDDRKGAQKLLQAWEKQREKEQKLHDHFMSINSYERKLRKEGYTYIAGIDEVGRGPLAGPVVTAAVILPADFYLPGINDSKKLSEKKRELYYEKIQAEAIAIGIGMIDPEEIDRINIYQATKKGMLEAIQSLNRIPDYLLIDAMNLTTPYPSQSIVKGDSKSVSIAAASIIAKVTRDRLMKDLDKEYPDYHFASNMGYGTKDHLHALELVGISKHHRKSFSPIKEMVEASRS